MKQVAIKIKADDLAIQFFYGKLKSPAFASALVERFKDLRECIVIEQDDLRAADGTREVLIRFKPSDALSDFMAAFAG